MIPKAVIIRKGIYSNLDSYSAFADNVDLNETQLYRDLKKRCITDIFVCGIATDVCVGKYIRSQKNHKSGLFALNFPVYASD